MEATQEKELLRGGQFFLTMCVGTGQGACGIFEFLN